MYKGLLPFDILEPVTPINSLLTPIHDPLNTSNTSKQPIYIRFPAVVMLWHNAGLEDGACCPCGGKKRMARKAAAEAAAVKEGKEVKEVKFKPRAMERFCKDVFVPNVHGTTTGRVLTLVSTVAWLGMLIGFLINPLY